MVYRFFDKKTRSGANVNKERAQNLNKPIIKTFKRRKVYSRFKYDIWVGYLAETRSLSSFNCSVKYLLCVIDGFTR